MAGVRGRLAAWLSRGADFLRTSAQRELMAGDYITTPYTQHAVVYACIRAITENLAHVPIRIYTEQRVSSEGVRELVDQLVDSGPLVQLIESPHGLYPNQYQWMTALLTYLLIDGEVNIVADRDDDTEIPATLEPCPKSQFSPITERGELVGWNRTSGNVTTRLETFQVVRPRLFNPANPLRGLSPLDPAARSLNADWQALGWNERFFANGAIPRGALKSKTALTPRQRAELLAGWQGRHAGAGAHQVALLTGDVDYQELGLTAQKDMEFTEQRRYTREEIAMIFRVPKTLLTVYDDVNFATALSEDRAFWMTRLVPLASFIEDVLWCELFRQIEGGRFWAWFDFSGVPAMREDTTAKLEQAKSLAALTYPINQINDKLGLGMDPIPWGDTALVPMGLIPATAAAEGLGIEQPEAGTGGEPAHGVAVPVIWRARPDTLAQWQRWTRFLLPHERRFTGKYKRFLMELRADQLKRLGALDLRVRATQADILEQVLFAESRWNDRLTQLVRPVYREVWAASAEELSRLVGGTVLMDMTDPAVLQALAEKEISVVNTSRVLRQNLRLQLMEGLNANESAGQLQSRIREVFNFQAARALTIARTEVGQAAGEARYDEMEIEGIERHSWGTAGDEEVRDTHVSAGRAGAIPLGEEFADTGCRFPCDPQGAAEEIINCRCVDIPEVR